MNWKPPASAPRDGRNFLLSKDGFVEIAHRVHGKENMFYGHTRQGTLTNPDGWMPLPDAAGIAA